MRILTAFLMLLCIMALLPIVIKGAIDAIEYIRYYFTNDEEELQSDKDC